MEKVCENKVTKSENQKIRKFFECEYGGKYRTTETVQCRLLNINIKKC